MGDLYQVLQLTGFLSLVLVAAFMTWKKIWFDQYGGKFEHHAHSLLSNRFIFCLQLRYRSKRA